MGARVAIAGGEELVVSSDPQLYVVVLAQDHSRILELRDGDDIPLGGARLRRCGCRVDVEGVALVNGAPIASTQRLEPGDQVASGASVAIFGATRGYTVPTARHPRVVVDAAMQRLDGAIDRVADSPLAVLLLGEAGVGKQLLAETIHQRSPRQTQPFITIGCTELPEATLDGKLFGRGTGLFELRTGCTVYLADIEALPLPLQAKLLRMLERRVASAAPDLTAEVRLLAASTSDPRAEVAAGRFRQDLLFKISGFTLVVPPLRERASEIVPLAEHFAARAAVAARRATPGLADDARDVLRAYGWPGNVDQLQRTVERAVMLCGPTITAADLPSALVEAVRSGTGAPAFADVRTQLHEVERAAIVAALAAVRGNQTRAARLLGLSRRTLIYRMEKYGLKPMPAGRGDT